MDIAVTDVREMPERFHAQLNAKEKTYIYRMTVSEPCDPKGLFLQEIHY